MNSKRNHPLVATRSILACGLFIATCLLGACQFSDRDKIVRKATPHIPTNLHAVERFPGNFQRVVVLPCHHEPQDEMVLDYVDSVFRQELSKRRSFEPVFISRTELARMVGKTQLTPQEKLPESFLVRLLSEHPGVDGVMFLEVFAYRPYKPLALGVRGKLVDLHSGDFIWAIDETFDAGNASVIAAAENFQQRDQVTTFSRHSHGSVLSSPRAFAKYVADATFGTLPSR